MKKTFILFLILASLFALSGCEYYTEEAVSRAWEEGYEEGWDDGRESGYEDGYIDGHGEGYTEALYDYGIEE